MTTSAKTRIRPQSAGYPRLRNEAIMELVNQAVDLSAYVNDTKDPGEHYAILPSPDACTSGQEQGPVGTDSCPSQQVHQRKRTAMTIDPPRRKAPHRELLTMSRLNSLRPGDHVADSAMTGLTARVSPGGRVSYVFRYRTADGRQGCMTIGHWPEQSPQQARWLAVAFKNLLQDQASIALSREALLQRCADLERQLAELRAGDSTLSTGSTGKKQG